jgi:hypothetical protein
MGCKLAWALVLWLCHVAVAVANAVFGAHDDMGAGGVRALNRVRVWGLKYGFLGFADGIFDRKMDFGGSQMVFLIRNRGWNGLKARLGFGAVAVPCGSGSGECRVWSA